MLGDGSGRREEWEVVTGQVTARNGSPYRIVSANKTNLTGLAQTEPVLLCLARGSRIVIEVMSMKLPRGTARDDSSYPTQHPGTVGV